MALAVFVPASAAAHLERQLPGEELLIARCMHELASFATNSRVTAGVVDPAAGGNMDVDSVIGIMASHHSLPFFAYVPPTPWHLKAIFRLSKHGLRQVFLHRLLAFDVKLAKAVTGAGTNCLAFDFLSRLETRFADLPPELSSAVQDLFERPHRYERAEDLATQAGVPVKELYRRFHSTRIGTPNKLITAAKVLSGYSALRSSPSTIRRVSLAVGLEHSKQFSARIATIFGCSPKKLRAETNAEEIVLHLLEWLNKPVRRAG